MGEIILVLAVIFLATLVRSAFGFGEALIAVPLLALLIPVEVAAPLACLVSITVASVVVVQDWHKIHVGSAWRLVVATFLGIPLGLLVLVSVAEPVVKAVLGLVIVAFSGWCLAGKRQPEWKDDRLAWPFGFVAGVLGGAYGMNGPPLVVYGALRRWSPEHFRATLQGYFLPASLAGMLGYAVAGLWTAAVTRLFLLSLPAALVAIVVGRAVNRRLNGQRFLLCVHAGLIAVGVVLVVQSLWQFQRRHNPPFGCNPTRQSRLPPPLKIVWAMVDSALAHPWRSNEMHVNDPQAGGQATWSKPTPPGKLEAVQMAKERLGDVPASELRDYIEATFGIAMQPIIVTVLLGTLRERELLEASRRRSLAAAGQTEAGSLQGVEGGGL